MIILLHSRMILSINTMRTRTAVFKDLLVHNKTKTSKIFIKILLITSMLMISLLSNKMQRWNLRDKTTLSIQTTTKILMLLTLKAMLLKESIHATISLMAVMMK